ncbi:general secretion pathway protein GspK [Pseudomonas sp. NPDC088368]|jgi:general secretion pathway protein K|uniref:general secretion pathway protein GspK n=1 Tax=Pseudomonas sp. NPDC088368 TaxID=3364453 RepID=UPI00380D5D06
MNRSCQRGVALISVLLITSLALMVIGGLLRSQRLMLQGTAHQVLQLHLRQAALAAESIAIERLRESGLQEGETVNFSQRWATEPPGFRLSDIDVRLSIEDLGGRFNLTPLVASQDVDEVHALRWSRLLDGLGIEHFDLTALKDRPFTDATQLQRIPGLSPSDLQRLLPWVTVRPRAAALNANTAPGQVLVSLEGMTAASAMALIRQRPVEGYPDAESFVRSAALDGRGVSTHGLGVSSRWFRITAVVSVAQSRLRLVTDVERVANTERFRVIQRRLLSSADGAAP